MVKKILFVCLGNICRSPAAEGIFKKKIKDLISDYRVYGIVGTSFMLGAPFFLGHKSENPVFLNLYSFKALVINIVYNNNYFICVFFY